MPASRGTFNILSIDGGPAAPVQIRLLRKIEERFPGFLASTDMFAGTSDGAMVGMFLASRLPKNYEEAKRISLDILDDAIEFSNATLRAMQPTLGGAVGFALGCKPLIGWQRLERVLQDAFGDMMLAHVERAFLVTSFDCGVWQATNFIRIQDGCDLNCRGTIYEAILASAALPMYTPVYVASDGHRHLDGAFVANNPSLLAATSVLRALMRPEEYALPNPALSQRDALSTLRVLSLGLGEVDADERRPIETQQTVLQKWLNLPPDKPTQHALQWGWFDWILNRPGILPSMLHHAQNTLTDWECLSLFDATCYFRYAPPGATLSVVLDMAQGRADHVIVDADNFAAKQWKQSPTPATLLGAPPLPRLLEWIRTQWLVETVPNASPKPSSFSSQPPAPPDSQPPAPPLPAPPQPPKVRRSRSARNSR